MIYTAPAIVALAAGLASAAPAHHAASSSSASMVATSTTTGSMPNATMGMNSTVTGTGATTNGSLAYPCPMGYNLSYVETQSNYNYSLEDVIKYAGYFQNATWQYYLNGTGGNNVGATRYVATMNGSREEVLSQYDMNLSNVPLQIVTNLTHGPIMAPNGARVSNYSTVEQIYTNTSASSNGMNITTVKLFCNFCADNRMSGEEAVLMSLNTNLDTLGMELSGANITYPGMNNNPFANMTLASTSAIPTVSRSMNSMLSSTSSALGSAASTTSRA